MHPAFHAPMGLHARVCVAGSRSFVALLGLFFSLLLPAGAQEFSVLAGGTTARGFADPSYSWSLEYRQGLKGPLEASFTWINEGHFDGHHRDGVAAEAWYDFGPFLPAWSFSVGAGAYYFFDTQPRPGGESADLHAYAPIFSAALKYHFTDRWFVHAAANEILPLHDIRTLTAAVGLGYYFGPVRGRLRGSPLPGLREMAALPKDTTPNELTLFAGPSRVNTLFRTGSTALAAEYRRGLGPHFDASVLFLHEGDPQTVRRRGLAFQGWIVSTFPEVDDLEFGLGLGPYLNIDTKHPRPGQPTASPAISFLLAPTISWKLRTNLLARITWERVVTSYNRDADVWLVGLGYRWQ